MAVADFAKFVGFGAAVMLLAGALGAEADWEPESPTFGTIKLGNKRISIFDGFNKYVKTVVQGITGHRIKGSERTEVNRAGIMGKFFRGSTTPVAGVTWDVLEGKDYMGRPVTWQGELKNLAAPMSVSGIYDEVDKDGASGLLTGLMQFYGISVTDQRDFDRKAQPTKRDN